jgi:hypothetical protein
MTPGSTTRTTQALTTPVIQAIQMTVVMAPSTKEMMIQGSTVVPRMTLMDLGMIPQGSIPRTMALGIVALTRQTPLMTLASTAETLIPMTVVQTTPLTRVTLLLTTVETLILLMSTMVQTILSTLALMEPQTPQTILATSMELQTLPMTLPMTPATILVISMGAQTQPMILPMTTQPMTLMLPQLPARVC